MNTRTVEHYMTSDSRIQLSAEVARLAKIYGDNFKQVEYICDSNINIQGAIAQVVLAKTRLENGIATDDLIPEAVETARSLLLLDEAKKNLREDGVPHNLVLEITRRVLDKDIPNSREITINV